MNPKTLAGWLAFTLYISAARADASPGQLFEMRQAVTPAIEGLKRRDITPEETRRALAIVLLRVQTIMGKEWRPTGEWMVAIDQLIGEGSVRRTGNPDVLRRNETRRRAAQARARSRARRQPLPPDGR